MAIKLSSKVYRAVFFGCSLLKYRLHASSTNQDAPEEITSQWNQLWAAVTAPHTVIVFHLTNHYALVAALRQWIDPDGTVVRQLLTARRGQQPKTWIDFTEARSTMLKWTGYKMLRIHRSADPAAAAP
jgi:hypothetical protein